MPLGLSSLTMLDHEAAHLSSVSRESAERCGSSNVRNGKKGKREREREAGNSLRVYAQSTIGQGEIWWMAPRFCLCVFPYKRCFFYFIPPIFSLPFENDYKYSNLMFLLYFAFLTILLLLFVCSYRAIIFAIRHLWSSATSTAFRRTCRTHRSANNWKTCESRSDERFAKSSKSKVHFPSYHLNTFYRLQIVAILYGIQSFAFSPLSSFFHFYLLGHVDETAQSTCRFNGGSIAISLH